MDKFGFIPLQGRKPIIVRLLHHLTRENGMCSEGLPENGMSYLKMK